MPSEQQQQQQQQFPTLRDAHRSPVQPSQYSRTTNDNGEDKRRAVDSNTSENGTPVRATAATARCERERVSMEQVLLNCRWAFHYASPLFHFHRDELSEYAHDLVKALRTAALRVCGQQFGYSVSIRSADAFVVFQVQEERDRQQQRLEREDDRQGPARHHPSRYPDTRRG